MSSLFFERPPAGGVTDGELVEFGGARGLLRLLRIRIFPPFSGHTRRLWGHTSDAYGQTNNAFGQGWDADSATRAEKKTAPVSRGGLSVN